ncbi:MAG: PilZ domain-containing protein [Deltaproteobacteria bacterium]|nr:PilZ domain-containing protein [Deltaproteobacteria bacterium]
MIDRLKDKERRFSPRIETDFPCWLERESVTLLGTVTDLSSDGLFMRTAVTIAKGSKVDLTVNLGEGKVAVKGRVAWLASSAHKSKGTGIAISFDQITGGKNLLAHFVKKTEENKT